MAEADFDEFYARDYARLVGAIGLAVGDIEIARDAVDEALARAWERSRHTEIDCLAGWARVVALNVARSGFRRKAAERRATDRLVARAIDPVPQDSAQAIDVAAAIATLAPRQREVTILHYFLDVSVHDIAAELNLSEGSVKASLHRARTALAKRLAFMEARTKPGSATARVNPSGRLERHSSERVTGR